MGKKLFFPCQTLFIQSLNSFNDFLCLFISTLNILFVGSKDDKLMVFTHGFHSLFFFPPIYRDLICGHIFIIEKVWLIVISFKKNSEASAILEGKAWLSDKMHVDSRLTMQIVFNLF